MQYKGKIDHLVLRPRANEDDDDEDTGKLSSLLDPKKKPYNVWEHTHTAQEIHIYFNEEFKAPNLYAEIIHRINLANPSDVVFIHLNTPGGRIDTGVQIINAMQGSQAKIVTILEATAYSLGTLIFLSGDEMIVHDNCMMMIHNWRGGLGGKGNEIVAELASTVKWFTAIAKKIYTPFLSKDELERVMKGEDFWMTSSEIRKRLNRLNKQLNAEELYSGEDDEDIAVAPRKQRSEKVQTPQLPKKRGRPKKS